MNESTLTEILRKGLGTGVDPVMRSCHIRKWSVIYEFRSGSDDFILKMPNPYGKKLRRIGRIQPTEQLVREARNEWESLTELYDQTRNPECPIAFVEPVTFLEAVPAVVTRKVEGRDFYRFHLLRKRADDVLRNKKILWSIGKAFGFLHLNNPVGTQPMAFGEVSLGDTRLDEIGGSLFKSATGAMAPTVRAMQGFSITDVLVTPKEEVYFLDPGKMDETAIYRDLAKLIAELTKALKPRTLFSSRECEPGYEAAFLEGYMDGGIELDHAMLDLCVSELLGREMLRQRGKPAKKFTVSSFIGALGRSRNVEAFYLSEIDRRLKKYRM